MTRLLGAPALVLASTIVILASTTAPDESAVAQTASTADASKGRDPNVCLDREIRRERNLKCPDLKMRPPFALDKAHVNGKPVLRAANSINSVGRGPAELAGRRSGQYSMNAFQRVRKKGGGRMIRKTKADLYFKFIPGQGRYWKFRDAAKFSLWLLTRRGERVRRVEVGPKMIYCLRDLEHTRPGLNASPRNRQYPACSQDPSRRRVTLGTSVGWSDVYPSTYHENWIELDDIPERGCYSFVHTADPNNGIYELNERNNQASTTVFLTPGGGYKPGRCRGVHDQSIPKARATDDSQVSDVDPEPPY